MRYLLVAVLVCAGAITACGGDNGDSPTVNTSSTPGVAATMPARTTSTTAPAAPAPAATPEQTTAEATTEAAPAKQIVGCATDPGSTPGTTYYDDGSSSFTQQCKDQYWAANPAPTSEAPTADQAPSNQQYGATPQYGATNGLGAGRPIPPACTQFGSRC